MRSRTRSARAALGWGVFATGVAIVWLSLALETSRPEWRDPEFGHRLLILRGMDHETPSRPLVLFFGTSRTQNAIHPAAMSFANQEDSPRVFNFGQSGATPVKVLLTLQRLFDEGIRPSAILVEILPVWLSSREPAEDQFRDQASQLSLSDLHVVAEYSVHPDDVRSRWRIARASPWSAQRVSLMSHWFPHWLPWQKRIDFQWRTMESDGFVPFLYNNPPATVRAAATAQTRQQFATAFAGFESSPLAIQALRAVVSKCHEQGIAIAFFEPPVAPVFQEWFGSEVWMAGKVELRAFADEIRVELFPCPNDFLDGDFADGHHMLRGAADRYSRWLAEAHLREWLARKQGKDQ